MLELFSESISFSELIVAVFEIVVGHSNPSVSTCIVNEPLVYAPILPRSQVSNPATSDVGVNDPVTNVVPVGIWSDIITPLAINAERFCHDILYIRIFQIYVLVIFTDFEIDTSASKQSYTWFSFISWLIKSWNLFSLNVSCDDLLKDVLIGSQNDVFNDSLVSFSPFQSFMKSSAEIPWLGTLPNKSIFFWNETKSIKKKINFWNP